MFNRGNLKPSIGSNKKKKRVGRGPASGNGKTAGKGHKGQKARKGGGIPAGFEGGQTPLYRRLPKYGFTNTRTKKEYKVIFVEDLNKFPEGTLVDKEALLKAKIVKSLRKPIKVVSKGKLDVKINVKGFKLTKGAKLAIESTGGKSQEK